MKILLALLVVFIAGVASKPYGVGADFNAGADLPVLGRVSLGAGGGLDFNGGLFGLARNLIQRFLGVFGLGPRYGYGGWGTGPLGIYGR